MIFSTESAFSSGDVSRFSTARTTPSAVLIPVSYTHLTLQTILRV